MVSCFVIISSKNIRYIYCISYSYSSLVIYYAPVLMFYNNDAVSCFLSASWPLPVLKYVFVILQTRLDTTKKQWAVKCLPEQPGYVLLLYPHGVCLNEAVTLSAPLPFVMFCLRKRHSGRVTAGRFWLKNAENLKYKYQMFLIKTLFFTALWEKNWF